VKLAIRKAGLTDLSALCAFGKDQHAKSNYADCAPFNAVMTRQFFKEAMSQPAQALLIAKDTAIRGLIAGHVTTYQFSHTLFATDVLFVADAGGDLLLDGFIAWAKRRGARIMESAPSQSDRYESLCHLYERKGFVRCGGTFRLMLQEAPSETATA
jgi:hypothetical protein